MTLIVTKSPVNILNLSWVIINAHQLILNASNRGVKSLPKITLSRKLHISIFGFRVFIDYLCFVVVSINGWWKCMFKIAMERKEQGMRVTGRRSTRGWTIIKFGGKYKTTKGWDQDRETLWKAKPGPSWGKNTLDDDDLVNVSEVLQKKSSKWAL